MRRMLSLLLIALAAACTIERVTPTDTRNLDGVWSGVSSGTTFIVNLTSGGDGLVMGTGTIQRSDTATRAVAAMGSYAHPRVSFYMSTPGYDSLSFSGTRNGDVVVGTLRGQGYDGRGLSLTLHR